MVTLPLYVEHCVRTTPYTKNQYITELGMDTNYIGNSTLTAGSSKQFYIELITPITGKLIPPQFLSSDPKDFCFRVSLAPYITRSGANSLNDLIQITDIYLEYRLIQSVSKEINNWPVVTHHRFLNRNVLLKKNQALNANEKVELTWPTTKGFCPFFFVAIRDNSVTNNTETFVKLTYLNYTDSGDNSYLNNNTYTDEQLDRNFIRSFAHEFAPITNIVFVNWSTRPLDVLLNDSIVAGCKYINPNDKLIISVGSNIASN